LTLVNLRHFQLLERRKSMISSEHCREYAVLLRIRQAAARRVSIFLGTIWGVGLVSAFVYNFYTQPNSQSVFLTAAILILFGLGFALQLARLETLRQLLEMVNFLERESRPT
jgi:sulfite exporter TauE/SafE